MERCKSSGVLFKLRIDQVDGVTPGVVYFQTVTGGIRSEYVVPKVFLICSAQLILENQLHSNKCLQW
jgi:hypothetical protein